MTSPNNVPKTCWTLIFCLTLPGVLVYPPARAATPNGEQILVMVDETMTRARDQYFEYTLATYKRGRDPQVLKFSVHIMGDKKRRIEFMAPGDIKGTRFLVLDVDQMWVYMPAYKKVRRVASHVKAQGFMGSAYSHDEMSIVTFGDIYTAKLLGQDDDEWRLELSRRPGQTYPYPKLEIKIRKDIFQPIEIAYFNDKGMKIKTESRESFECRNDLCNPRLMTMIDHTRGDLKSVMARQKWKPNTGVDDRHFSVRSLQRRR